MLRAEPSIMRMAAAMSLALRSFILISAISRTFARAIVPAGALFGAPLPLSIPAAFLIRSAAGGVLVTKLNERSSKIVIKAGMTMPDWVAVRSLYSFKNAIMLMPCWPNAGPTGGAGVALPAGSCSVMTALTFFAIQALLDDPLHLQEIELDGRLAAEERHQYPHFALFRIDVVNHADEIGKRTIDDLDAFALSKADFNLGRLLADLFQDLFHFVVLER